MAKVGLAQSEPGEERLQELEDAAFWCTSFLQAFSAPG